MEHPCGSLLLETSIAKIPVVFGLDIVKQLRKSRCTFDTIVC